MKRDDIFPSKYLKAEDLGGKPHIVQIASAPVETLKSQDGKEQRKAVLYFMNAKKRLPLNLTNFDSVAEICGPDTDDWPGRKIELYPSRTQMAGKTVDCVRIRAPSAPGQRPAAPPIEEAFDGELHDEMDDESAPF